MVKSMPRLPRFFITPDQVNGTDISLSGEDVRHISLVLRMKPGDNLLVCDGAGREYVSRIVSMDRSAITAAIQETAVRKPVHPRITLAQGLPKFDKMDLIVQKAVELGVSTIIPIVTERTIVKIRDEQKRLVRWVKIAREAAMQSNRAELPVVEPVQNFTQFTRTMDADIVALKLLPWEEASEPIKNTLQSNKNASQIIVLIGPEGGFSRIEAETARSSGYHVISLGPNILRSETAGMAAVSMIQYEYT